jgi:hypothetical protein
VAGGIAVAIISRPDKTPAPAPAPAPVVGPVTPVVTPVVPPEPVAAPAPVDISGPWHDPQHAVYVVAQQGGAITIAPVQMPANIAGGTIIGNVVQWEYRAANGAPGRCSGRYFGGAQMQIDCVSQGVNYPFPLHRPNSG